VALQNENAAAAETVTRMRAEHTVLVQKKRRLETALEGHNKEIKQLGTAMGRLHVELTRVNGLIANNASAREDLAEDNLRLEAKIKGEGTACGLHWSLGCLGCVVAGHTVHSKGARCCIAVYACL
jgi:coiled-coil domain-containing protein 40